MSQSGSVSIKRFRDKLGFYIRLPGELKRFNLNLGLADNPASEKLLEDEAVLIKADMLRGDRGGWQALHERYSRCEEFAARLPAGAGLTMDELFNEMVDNWNEQIRRSIPDMLYKLVEVREFFKGKKVCDVTTETIIDFRRKLRDRGLGVSAINRKICMVRRALNLAKKIGRIKEMPAFPETYKEPLARQTRFTWAEIDRLIEKLPERLKRVVELASLIGWRLDELLSRKWRTDIDFAEGLIYLEAAESKNGEPRLAPITPRIKAVLEAQIEWVRQLERQHNMVIQWLFPNDDPRHPIGERMKRLDRAFQTACEEAGLNVDANGKPVRRWFHDFRRSAQDYLEKLGLTDLEQMDVIGHKTLSMHKRYRGTSDPRKTKAIGAKLAQAEAAAPKANVVNLEAATMALRAKLENSVQHACNTGTDGAAPVGGVQEKPDKSGTYGRTADGSEGWRKTFHS